MNLTDEALKQDMKEALMETLRENRGFIHEVIVEGLEDFALTEAVREGRGIELVEREDIFDILEGERQKPRSEGALRGI